VIIESPTGEIPKSPKETEEVMSPKDGVKWKVNGVVDSVPPDEGCEVLGGELSDKEWGKNDNKTVAVTRILIKWGVIIKCYWE